MPTSNEREAMTVIADESGQCGIGVVSRGIGLTREYTRIILESLGRAEYLDMTRTGKVVLKVKGYRAIGREPNFEQQWTRELQGKCEHMLDL